MTDVVAGVGFRREAPADEIVDLVGQALGRAAIAHGRLASLATAEPLATREAFREAARRLGVEAVAVAGTELRGADTGIRTRSARSLAAHGVGSVAEASALAAAGGGATLILPRIASAAATCALALGQSGGRTAP